MNVISSLQAYPIGERVRVGIQGALRGRNPLVEIAHEGVRRPIGDLLRGAYLARITTIERLFSELEKEGSPQRQYALAYSISLLWLERGMRIGARIENAETAMAAQGVIREERVYCEKYAQMAVEFLFAHPELPNEARQRVAFLTAPYPIIHESFKP